MKSEIEIKGYEFDHGERVLNIVDELMRTQKYSHGITVKKLMFNEDIDEFLREVGAFKNVRGVWFAEDKDKLEKSMIKY